MNNKRKIFNHDLLRNILIVFLSNSFCLYAQDNSIVNINVIPPSPTTAGLGKYAQEPVSLFTGSPSISIPLYDIKTQKLGLNVSLSYHASGIKVEEEASWVGLGWSLNAGGVITRTVKGRPDDEKSYDNFDVLIGENYFGQRQNFSTISNITEHPDNEYNGYKYNPNLEIIANGTIDIEPDAFYFNFPGGAGQMYFLEDGVMGYGNIVTKPHSDLKIKYTKNATTGKLEEFIITTTDGVKFTFGGNSNAIETNSTTTVDFQFNSVNDHFNQSWYLTKIESPDGLDEITFDYTTLSYSEELSPRYITHRNTDNCPQLSWTAPIGDYYSSRVDQDLTICKLSKINFSNGEIIFNSSSDRLDKLGDKKLDYIEVRKKTGTTFSRIKKFDFNNSYYFTSKTAQEAIFEGHYIASSETGSDRVLAMRKRLKLVSVTEYGKTDTDTKPAYLFSYYKDDEVPPRYSFAMDHWGFYNGKNSNASLLPSNGADRTPTDLIDIAQAGCLKKIEYPLGGTTEYVYKLHADYSFIGNVETIEVITGGIRIDKIIANDPLNNALKNIRRFVYSSSRIFSIPLYNFQRPLYTVKDNQPAYLVDCQTCIFDYKTNFNVSPFTYIQGSHVAYKDIEIFYDSESETGKNGKTSYNYILTEKGIKNSPRMNDNKEYIEDILHGVVKNIKEYKKKPDNTYQIIKETINDYEITSTDQVINSLSVSSLNMLRNSGNTSSGTCTPTDPLYDVTYSEINIGDWLFLQNKIETVYDDNLNTITHTTDFDYISPSRLLSITQKNLNGKDIIKEFTYPSNYTDQLHDAMVDLNMTSNIIEEKVFEKTASGTKNLISANKTVYSNFFTWSDPRIYPSKKQSAPFTVPLAPSGTNYTFSYEDKLTISYDNDGNIGKHTKTGGTSTSYIYGYAHTLPIASAANAQGTEIAYTSFEIENEKGNWTHNLSITNGESKTGESYASMGTSPISFSGLDANKKYILSFWANSHNTTFYLNSISFATETNPTSWKYYEKEFTGVTSIDLSATSNSGYTKIDELRLHPKDAQMVTFTYDPLIGKTSETDAKKITTYYEYDGMGRLKLIRDQNKNIRKRNTYNYKQ